jgi:hypothetical protein
MLWHSGTVPAKVLLQLTTAFRDGGLRNRTGTFFFKEHLHKIKVPVLALAGDEDLICPPEAVYGLSTISRFPLLFCNDLQFCSTKYKHELYLSTKWTCYLSAWIPGLMPMIMLIIEFTA